MLISRRFDRHYPFSLSDTSAPHPPDNFNMSLAPEDYVRLLSSAFDLHPEPIPRGGGEIAITLSPGPSAGLGGRPQREGLRRRRGASGRPRGLEGTGYIYSISYCIYFIIVHTNVFREFV